MSELKKMIQDHLAGVLSMSELQEELGIDLANSSATEMLHLAINHFHFQQEKRKFIVEIPLADGEHFFELARCESIRNAAAVLEAIFKDNSTLHTRVVIRILDP